MVSVLIVASSEELMRAGVAIQRMRKAAMKTFQCCLDFVCFCHAVFRLLINLVLSF